MYKTAFIILLFAHILGDFYFQTQKFADQKEKSLRKVLQHSIFYTSACLFVIIPVINKPLFIAAAFMSLTHLGIDTLKYLWLKRAKTDKGTKATYIADQIAHLFFMFTAALFVAVRCDSLKVLPRINKILTIIGIDKLQTLSLLLLILLIWKPANITIKKILSSYKPREDSESRPVSNAGSFIGLLERIIIVIFLSIGQYSAIGLVLTAKSIARYNKISEDKEFAEYYLLGTLLSTIIAIISYIAVM